MSAVGGKQTLGDWALWTDAPGGGVGTAQPGTALPPHSFYQFPKPLRRLIMSATGIDAFDKTLQTTNIWLNEIMAEIGPDRQVAWKVLSTVLHKLRDRLPIGLAAHLGAQLPLLVRGAYYDQFEPARLPAECASREQFTAEVAEWMSDTRPVDPDLAVRAVFGVLSRHVAEGQIDKVCQALPKNLRQWFEGIRQQPQLADTGGDMKAPNMNADHGADGDASAFFADRGRSAGSRGQPGELELSEDQIRDRDGQSMRNKQDRR